MLPASLWRAPSVASRSAVVGVGSPASSMYAATAMPAKGLARALLGLQEEAVRSEYGFPLAPDQKRARMMKEASQVRLDGGFVCEGCL
jgi:hypothetical protein